MRTGSYFSPFLYHCFFDLIYKKTIIYIVLQLNCMATKKSPLSDYSESSIRVINGLEPVKQRPRMYTRNENPLNTIQEVIDNASDEALGGNCEHILVMKND